MRRGVFGGSFDPIHFGHLRVAAAAADRLTLDRVHFVPARAQPFKQGRHRATAADRVAMLRLALDRDPRFVLDLREIERGGPSYTVETLDSLRREFPDDHLFLLVGADAARDLPAWHESARLPELATVVVLTRPGSTTPDHRLLAHVVEVPAIDLSASDVRERVARGESVQRMVPDTVADYIARRELYSRE